MKTAILTGGTGFLGYWLLKELVKNGVFVYVVVRKNSKRRYRLKGMTGIEIIELDMDQISNLPKHIKTADVFYHLAWEGDRNDFSGQMNNITLAINAMKAAQELGTKQFIMTGSQAEYGIYSGQVDENSPTNPNTAYGSCKLACYNILKTLSDQIDLQFTWVRVFSVYGEGDNPNTLISYLFKCFKENIVPEIMSGKQLWDFLYAKDAVAALYLLAENNKTGIFNLAYGESRPLREFIIEARDLINPKLELNFNSDTLHNGVQLNANIDKIKNETGWKPSIIFNDGILHMKEFYI